MVTNKRLDAKDDQDPMLLTPQQAAKLLQVSEDTIYQWSSKRKLEKCAFRSGKHLRIDKQELLNMLRRGEL